MKYSHLLFADTEYAKFTQHYFILSNLYVKEVICAKPYYNYMESVERVVNIHNLVPKEAMQKLVSSFF